VLNVDGWLALPDASKFRTRGLGQHDAFKASLFAQLAYGGGLKAPVNRVKLSARYAPDARHEALRLAPPDKQYLVLVDDDCSG